MSANLDWIEHFRISPAHLEKWRQEAGPNEDLLRWCLLNGKIAESDYLQWACEHYELPVVEADYFSLPPDAEFWERVRKAGPWTAARFPLQEWQGMWLIACVSPESDVSFAKPHRFVLSSARALNMLWATLNHHLDVTLSSSPTSTAASPLPTTPDIPEKAAAPATVDAPEGLAAAPGLGALEAPDNNAPDGIVLKDLFASGETLTNSASPPEIDPEVTADIPQGLADILSTTPSAPTIDSPASESGTITDKARIDKLNFDIPEAFTDAAMAVPDLSVPPPNEPAQGTRSEVRAPPPPPPPPPTMAKSGVRETTNIASVSDGNTLSGARIPLPPSAPAPQIVKGTPKEIPASRSSLDLGQIDGGKPQSKSRSGAKDFGKCSSIEDVTELAFSKMQLLFQKSIMLVFQGGQLRPWKWTGTVNYSGKGKPSFIDLDNPSIFRIVFNTALPYHGYITPNATNDQFFAEFNGGVTPAHATIMPVMVNGKIAGMLMGLTDGQISLRTALRQMETLTDEVSHALGRIRTGKAA